MRITTNRNNDDWSAREREADETSILAKLRITKDDLRKLKIALDRVGN